MAFWLVWSCLGLWLLFFFSGRRLPGFPPSPPPASAPAEAPPLPSHPERGARTSLEGLPLAFLCAPVSVPYLRPAASDFAAASSVLVNPHEFVPSVLALPALRGACRRPQAVPNSTVLPRSPFGANVRPGDNATMCIAEGATGVRGLRARSFPKSRFSYSTSRRKGTANERDTQ